MTDQLSVPRRASRDKSPIQEKIDLFMKSTSKGDHPSKLGELEYGRPVVGSKTEARGLKAHAHVFKEILELCEIIHSDGDIRFTDEDGEKRVGILFGDLFRIYTVISDKCVGLLLRARKHHLVTFEGETLFQMHKMRRGRVTPPGKSPKERRSANDENRLFAETRRQHPDNPNEIDQGNP